MKFYLVQHGEATTKEEHPDRPLTKKGKEDSRKTAEILKDSRVTVDVIWHSEKTRAIETAGIIAKEIVPQEGTEMKEGLAPNDPVEKVLESVVSLGKDVMIVGHLPFLQKILSLALLGTEEKEVAKFIMAGAICLEKDEEGKWQILYKINPDLI